MIARKLIASLAGACALAYSGMVLPGFDPVGDDTDIFLANPLLEATRPNVLFFVDNTANWTPVFDIEKQTLLKVTDSLVTDAFNVGMGMFVETGSPNDSVDGGYIRFGLRQMTPTNKERFMKAVDALDVTGDKGNNATYSLAMDEVFRYFAGKQSYAGIGKAKRDFFGNKDYNPYSYDLEGAPFDDEASKTYVSPIVSGCQKNFIIFISNGPAGDNSSSLDESKKFLTDWMSPSALTEIGLAPKPTGEQKLWADEYAKMMAEKDCASHIDGVQNVFTYTIDVLPKATGGGPDHTALLQSMASNGKGRYFAVTDASTTKQLEDILRQIFVEVQAVNSVFASVALPVSVNVRGTNLNQVYIGQFRPDKNRLPRWYGNLKMYKIGEDTVTDPDGTQRNIAFLVDAKGNRAEIAATGFVSPNAESFWTVGSTFWSHRLVDENGAGGASDLPDGDLVEKGGSAEYLRIRNATDQALRQMYTCTSSSGFCAAGSALSASPFAVSNDDVTAADLNTYEKKTVVTITAKDNGDGTATGEAVVTAHGWASGDEVKIIGATPNVYNQTAIITTTSVDRFTYLLPTAPPADIAIVTTSSAHNLVTGDAVRVDKATPSEYDVVEAPITVLPGNTFQYQMSGSTYEPSSGQRVFSMKRVASLSGVGSAARATVVGHGYGAASAVPVCCVHIEGAKEDEFNSDPSTSGVSFVILDANTISYTTPKPITSGVADTARVSAPGHGFFTGHTVTITGASEPLFNGSFAILKIDDNNFSYTISGSAVTASNAGMVASIGISAITHPTTGSAASRDIATVTTSQTHGFTPGQNVVIAGTGGAPGVGYDGTFAVISVSGSSFTISHASFDSSPTPLNKGTAGRAVTRIDPVVTATGTIKAVRQMANISQVASQAVATGTMLAGRPKDFSKTERENLITWVRGRDNYENEKANTAAPDVRPSAHGDVLHSRPAVVNYGRGSIEDDVYIYYGTNDGGLRAVKGGLNVVSGDNHPNGDKVLPGDERWTFIPKELFGKLDRLRTRVPAISKTDPRDYFVDGAISAFTQDVNGDGKLVAADGDKVYLYMVLRRGGDSIYALDVSDPAEPKFLWRKQAGDPGYAELGQTWSEARVVRIAANTRPSESAPTGNPDNLVLVMGAGYDPEAEDAHPCLTDLNDSTGVRNIAVGTGLVTFTADGSCSVSKPSGAAQTVKRTRGRGVMVIDALDGHVIWQAGPEPKDATHNVTISEMAYSVPSDVRVSDLNGDGLADSAFVGDTGGNVWRIDLADADPAKWRVRLLAALAPASDTDLVNKRKFMFAPEVVVAEDTKGIYLAILIGSGDREHPFDGLVQNRFYMLKDRGEAGTFGSLSGNRSWTAVDGASPSKGAGGGAVAGGVIREVDLFTATASAGANDSGWMRGLAPGEKIVSSALAVAGTAIFSSNQPTVLAGTAIDACASNLGVARIYTIGIADASGEAVVRAGGGYVPSPVFAAIQIGATGGGSGTTPTSSVGACVGAACGDTTTSGGGPGSGGPTTGIVCTGTSCWSVGKVDVNSRRRAYWYKEID
jgi:type IV pilus assembly protein PilY1